MTEDQVLGNIMLSASQALSAFWTAINRHLSPFRHQLLGLSAQEELAKRQVAAHQDDHGQARPLVLSVVRLGRPLVRLGVWGGGEREEGPRRLQCTT